MILDIFDFDRKKREKESFMCGDEYMRDIRTLRHSRKISTTYIQSVSESYFGQSHRATHLFQWFRVTNDLIWKLLLASFRRFTVNLFMRELFNNFADEIKHSTTRKKKSLSAVESTKVLINHCWQIQRENMWNETLNNSTVIHPVANNTENYNWEKRNNYFFYKFLSWTNI